MATVIPDQFGAALERSTQNLMQLILANRQFQLDSERLAIQRTQVDEQTRRNALERLLTFAPFLPSGKAISEIPEIHESLRTVFPEFDPASPGDLGGIVLNERSLEDVMRPLAISAFEGLSPEAQKSIVERGMNRELLGVPATGTELEAQETRSRVLLDAYAKLSDDPVALDAIFRRQMGLEQPIRIRVGDRTLQWDTGQAASLAVQLMLHQDNLSLRRRELSGEAQTDLVAELMKQMEAAGEPISRPVATQIVSAYNRRAQLYNNGQLTAENDPLAPLVGSENPNVAAAAQFFVGAGQLGEKAFEDYLRESGPAGQQVLLGTQVMGALKDAGAPAEQVLPLAESVLEMLGGGQEGSPFPSIRSGFWRQPGFEISAPLPEDVQNTNTSMDPNAITIRAIQDVVGAGQATREQAIARFGEEIVNQALGAPTVSPSGPRSAISSSMAGASTHRATPDTAALSSTRQALAEAEAELASFLAPVAGRPAEQVEARRNSARGRSLQARIDRIRQRIATLEAAR